MNKQSAPGPQQPVRPTVPSKEAVRAWLAERRRQRTPPPELEQIRAQLNWR